MLIQTIKVSGLKKRLNVFMKGKNAKSLEDTLIRRLNQLDEIAEQNEENKRGIYSIKFLGFLILRNNIAFNSSSI